MQIQLSRRSFLLIAYCMFFVMAIPTGILNVAWTYMQGTFGVSLDSLGVLLLVATCGGLLGAFFSGRVIGRIGVGGYLSGGSIIALLGLLGYSFAPTWILVLSSVFLMALGLSTFNAGLNLFVSANYTTGQLNWLHAAYGLGLTVGPTLATLVVERLGQSWHFCYLIMFVMVLALTMLLWSTRRQWVIEDEDHAIGALNSAPIERVSMWESLHVPAVLIGITLFMVMNGIIGSTGQLSSTLLTARGIADAGFWVSAYWASFTVGRIIMGFIAHRLDNTRLIRYCILGAIIGAVLLWQNASSLLNLLGLGMIGFSCAPLYPTMVAETR
ncbi:MAG: MFS transporter, partial [Chloroflexota bacterium]